MSTETILQEREYVSHEVEHISECFVRPLCEVENSKRKHYLTRIELYFLPMRYAQHGQLFLKHSNYSSSIYLEKLKISLAQALTHFYPLAGRLETERFDDYQSSSIIVDCKKGPGAKLIYTTGLQLKISDIASPHKDVPLVVRSFFDLGERAIGYEGHIGPLLSVQVTELSDAVFLGLSISHCTVEGTSSMNFMSVWSEIFWGSSSAISRVPIYDHKSSNPDGYGPRIKLPKAYIDGIKFVRRVDPGQLRDRIFSVSKKSMVMLKAKSEEQVQLLFPSSDVTNISTFQALSAFIWRAVTRARSPSLDETTTCRLAVDLRLRLKPPLPRNCFGVVITTVRPTAMVGALLAKNLGWASMLIRRAVAAIDDKAALRALSDGIQPPTSNNLVVMSGSARMNLCEPEFGMGRAVGVLTGVATKIDGKVFTFMGSEGQGSVELHISLASNTMDALLSDKEFFKFVSPLEIKPRL